MVLSHYLQVVYFWIFNYRLLFFPWLDQYTKLAGQALAIHIKFKISLAKLGRLSECFRRQSGLSGFKIDHVLDIL